MRTTDPDGREGHDERGLNPYQRTALAVALEQLEQSVGQIERLLDDPPVGATYRMALDLRPDTVKEIRQQCAAVRRQIAEAVAAFDLPQRPSSARRMIVAEMSSAWANLEDLRPSKLRRYGSVDPVLDETWSPRLERLIRLVLDIAGLARDEERMTTDE